MGRSAEGYRVRWRDAKRGYTVRFTLDRRYELSTGVRSRAAKAEAEREARTIYAEHVTGARRKGRAVSDDVAPLLERVSEWLTELPVRAVTRQTYEGYSAFWLREFASVHAMTTARLEQYAAKRLRQSSLKAVKNEWSALNGFARWLRRRGYQLDIPPLPAGVSGSRYKHRRRTRAPELTPAEVRKVLAALPEWSDIHRFPVRARFTVAYETSLRPATLDKLRAPENYSKGGKAILLTAADDKESYGREVPLSLRARRALDSVCPKSGLLFGEHDYVRYLPAAKASLPAHKAAVFTWQHLRSARITHWLEQTSDLPGVQYLAGHKHASTTGKYVRPSLRAAQSVLRRSR